MIREKNKIVNNFLAVIDVFIAWVALDIALFIQKGDVSFFSTDETILLHLLLLLIWFTLSKVLRVSELYRSRPVSILLFNCILLSVIGSALLVLFVFLLKQRFSDIRLLVNFAGLSLLLIFTFKVVLFSIFKNARKRGYNYSTVVIIGDKSAVPLINKFIAHNEWGYKIGAVLGADLNKYFDRKLRILPEDTDIDKLLEEEAIDEVIYCYEMPDMKKVQNLLLSCSEVGVVFRMHSPIFNMLSNKTHMHYFGTTPLLTISNTPLDYLTLKAKRFIDFAAALSAIIILSPVFVTVALFVVFSSNGPVFFKQIRVGLRGRQFLLYKFRTMVVNAEELKEKLEEHNEMDGPVFKMTLDPRITGVGKILRKTGLDELPQFFNVLLGNMSLVGPRPPVPKEVKEYERWQLRRLSMKPGITCTWQISESRNEISFEEWMRMDMEYIDNWSLRLDFVIILKTIRTVLRADGK